MINKFFIDRARWGQNALKSTDTGKMCCLGFLSVACGVPEEKLFDTNVSGHRCERGFPNTHWFEVPKEFRHGDGNPGADLADQAVEINDGEYPDAYKEAQLIKLFGSVGIELIFEGTKEPA